MGRNLQKAKHKPIRQSKELDILNRIVNGGYKQIERTISKKQWDLPITPNFKTGF